MANEHPNHPSRLTRYEHGGASRRGWGLLVRVDRLGEEGKIKG